MNTMWQNDLESEAYDESEGEDYGDDYDSEDARTDRARRAREAQQQQIRRVLAQRRRTAQRARMRPRSSAVVRAPAQRPAISAIRDLDLETKVGQDSLRRAIDRSNERATRATYATVASVAVNQALDTFSATLDNHSFVRVGLRLTPLLLLSPQRSRSGIEGIVLHPTVMGGAALAGIVATGEFINRKKGVQKIDITPKTVSLGTAQTGKLFAMVTDRNGAPLPDVPTWNSSDAKVLDLATDGTYTANAIGIVTVTVEAGGLKQPFFVSVAA